MKPTEQIKNARGEIKVKRVSFSPGGEDGKTPSLVFLPQPCINRQREDEEESQHTRTDLENLAFITADDLLKVAKSIGPLFGDSLTEHVAAWQDAAGIAKAAILIQAVANGNKSPMQLNGGRAGAEATPPPGSQINDQRYPVKAKVLRFRAVAAPDLLGSRRIPVSSSAYALVATLPRQARGGLLARHDR